MKVLIIDDDPSILELYGLVLENIFGKDCVDRALGPNDAISTISSTKNNYDLVISDYDMPPQGSGKEVYDYIKENNLNLKFILFTSRHPDEVENIIKDKFFNDNDYLYLNKVIRPKEWSNKVKELVHFSEKQRDYAPVRVYNFMRHQKSLCDIYIKLSDKKFIRIINKNENYSLEILEKYYARGTRHLYIAKTDFDQFVSSMSEMSFLETPTVGKTYLEAARNNHTVLKMMVQNLGISSYTFQLASQMAENVLNEIVVDSGVKMMIEKMMKSVDYAYDHSFLTACISAAICEELSLDRNIIRKLTLASLLHDLAITNSNLCRIHDLFPEEIINLNHSQKELIRQHHHLFDNMKIKGDLLEDVKLIISHHHIHDDLYPFNSSFHLDHAQLIQSIFLVSHAFTVELFKSDFNDSDKLTNLSKVKSLFRGANFEKAIMALDRVILVKKKA
ncbi:response regulator [Halobacteriovorax sp. GB3]|uniref:response regulator n=1 Tax=Halobacteriovorax sp. GB3 TaxID=2719615 RepID=UPI00235F2557|nr:response regulator [Halobacteriovorax sp. GB3]MDD0853492.1 response regulator [Halobacteriovorax sp. GB3]